MKKNLPLRRKIASQNSWLIGNGCVELAVTQLGGHMAPVTFCRDGGAPVQPYYISPWQDEPPVPMPATMVPLRGDFFCLPFGGNQEPWRGENHPTHGETAGSLWTLEDYASRDETTTLDIRLETTVRPGLVRRRFTLVKGHNAVYCTTVIEGFRGKTPFAHHAVLAAPRQEKALRLFTGPFAIGRTYPLPLSNPSEGEYQFLARDVAFRSLSRVSSIFKGEPPADCSAFPARPGFCDLLQQFERGGKKSPSWVAAINTGENWMWFALKDPSVMPGRLFWMENKGRHKAPWTGRNSCLGIEDGCMYFDRGIAASCRPNPINRRGIPTCVTLDGRRPFTMRYIQGAARVPAGFTDVARVEFPPGEAVFHSSSGAAVRLPVDHGFLFS